ncbi:transcription factor-like protein DPA isoform X2 [Durio zibethinus]|uniref:Transcription factor-like protein DPA isoform X2 n=1 Tax=Durio zibethinus TaxID=66656 RepID=A0A6P6ARX4_DURZI|nr:transcription factor-like protein DPA isoform X2 [Durio zibethinus]
MFFLSSTLPVLRRKRYQECLVEDYASSVLWMLESKGSTTYAEVADEIIEEFAATQSNKAGSLDEFHEKNVRRRVYDALNVLMAMDIIMWEKKEIRWKGLSTTQTKDLEELKALHVHLMTGIAKKAAYLKDLEEQIAGLQNIIERNQQMLKNNSALKEGFTLPFILVQTSSNATVEIEIYEDMQLVHLDFNSTPFYLHDDAYLLKLMRHYQQPESRNISQSPSIHSSSSSCKASGVSKPFH